MSGKFQTESNWAAKNNGWRLSIYTLSAMITLLMLLWVMKFCGYGIDLTDESFYIVWMANPFIYDTSLSQFGFIYHHLYRILDGNIALIRQINALVTFALGWSLCFIFIKSIVPKTTAKTTAKTVGLHVVAAGLACVTLAMLVFYSMWLPTPSYNSLTFQALLLVAIGLLWVNKTVTVKSVAGWVIVGVAGWLTFMAKPSSAALLALVVVIHLVAARNFSVKLVALAALSATVLLVASALAIDGSLLGFVERIKNGITYGQHLGGGHTVKEIFRLDTPTNLTDSIRAALLALAVATLTFFSATLVLAWGVLSTAQRATIPRTIAVVGAALCFALVILLALGSYSNAAISENFQYLAIVGAMLATWVIGAVYGGFSELRRIPINHWSIACLFVAMPYIYAFGSNANYWRAGASAAIFWLLAGLVALGPVMRNRNDWIVITPCVLVAQATTALLVYTGIENPYRQPGPLTANTEVVEFGKTGSFLRVSPDLATYIRNAKKLVRNAGFVAGTPVIDMTGQSPGVLYFLGAENIGQAWNIGGYEGSLTVAVTAFKNVSCKKIAAAWIIIEANGPKSIPMELVAGLGIKFPEDYIISAEWDKAPGVGGYSEVYRQVVYVPRSTYKIYSSCLNNRNE